MKGTNIDSLVNPYINKQLFHKVIWFGAGSISVYDAEGLSSTPDHINVLLIFHQFSHNCKIIIIIIIIIIIMEKKNKIKTLGTEICGNIEPLYINK